MRIAEEANGRYTLIYALRELGLAHLARGDCAEAIAPLERAVETSTTSQFTLVIPGAMVALGYALSLAGRSDDALPLLDDTVQALASPKFAQFPELHLARLGAAYLLADRLDTATEWTRIALEVCERCGAHTPEAYALKTLGDLSARPDRLDAEHGEVYYGKALAIAQELGMRPLVAHCHLGLRKLYRRIDKREQAREHLATATTMYRDMDMRFWLEKAEAEMRELG